MQRDDGRGFPLGVFIVKHIERHAGSDVGSLERVGTIIYGQQS